MAVDEFLNSPDAGVSILALSRSTKTTISNLLNPIKVIKNEERLPRNWEGLAAICGIGTHFIPSIESETDRTAKLLHMWCENNKEDATVGQLIRYLERLDRTDVVDDIFPLVAKDIQEFKEVSLTTSTPSQGLDLKKYDAFVLFDEDDIDFAAKIVNTLESQYDLKLCTSNRDLTVGMIQNTAIREIMQNRSSRIIVILSRKFLESETCSFLFSVAQQINLESHKSKIIPIVYKGEDDSENLNLPPDISLYVKLDYRMEGKPLGGNFWGRLRENIRAPDEVISNISRRRAVQPRSPIVQPNRAVNNGTLLDPSTINVRISNSLTTLEVISNSPEPESLGQARSEANVGRKPKTKFQEFCSFSKVKSLKLFKSSSGAEGVRSEDPVVKQKETGQVVDSNQDNIMEQGKEEKVKKKFLKKIFSKKKTAVPVAS